MSETEKEKPRSYLGILFKCCNVYSRIYINNKKTAFVGWCPRCAKRAVINISPDGESSNFFEVT